MSCYFVGINCYFLEPLTNYFSIKVKGSLKKRSYFFHFFSKPLQITIGIFFFLFSFQTNLYMGFIPLRKKSFQVMIRLFFFFFFSFFLKTNLSLGPYWKKQFQIMITLFFYYYLFSLFYFLNKSTFGGLIPLTCLRDEPTLTFN
jgi:hypothetical protein